jgi:RNA polymerase sigma-70 factor (ECF subfamily)
MLCNRAVNLLFCQPFARQIRLTTSLQSFRQWLLNTASLLERLQHHDGTIARQAFGELVKAHQRRLYALGYDLMGNAADAEDVVQETFVKAWLGRRTFRGEAQISTWLHRLAVNVALDMKRGAAYRQLNNRAALDEETLHSTAHLNGQQHSHYSHYTPASPDALTEATIAEERIQDALQTLSPQQRAVFVLRHYHDEPLAEIATTLGVSEGTVKTLLFRAVRALRERLAVYEKKYEV